LINFFAWFNQKGFVQGAIWTILACLTSNINDMIMKFLGSHLNAFQIVFFRAFFGFIFILPLILFKSINFGQRSVKIHSLRVMVGFIAIVLACYATTLFSLAEVTVYSFSQPLFFIPLAALVLNEQLSLKMINAMIAGFIGVIIVSTKELNNLLLYVNLIPLLSAFLFACLDIVNKKLTDSYSVLELIFYFNLGTSILSGIFLLFSPFQFKFDDLLLLVVLAISASLVQFFSIKALSAASILSLAPLRYTEIIFSILFGILFFSETPTWSLYIGCALIVSSVLYATYSHRAESKSSIT
jgi:S-adenosylmethionine uptake transporter